jgi:hypothetical protein
MSRRDAYVLVEVVLCMIILLSMVSTYHSVLDGICYRSGGVYAPKTGCT